MKLEITETTKQEVEINIPYYTKTLLTDGIVFCVAKIINEKQCIHVTRNDKIQIAHAGLAVSSEWLEATEQEFEDMYSSVNSFLLAKTRSA